MSFTVVGIDPGMKRTGVVLMNEDREVITAATFASGSAKFSKHHHGSRVADLAYQIQDWVDSECTWREDMVFDRLSLVIETPVMNKVRNVKGFSLQWRTVQAIISRFRAKYYAAVDVIEVHNTAVKIAATGRGDADKAEIIHNSPFVEGTFGDTVTGHDSVEALADAWGVALCAFDPLSKHIRYSGASPMACTEGPVHEQ
jgi:Holliday junction resolvasome RuvABC endonuclease subunit